MASIKFIEQRIAGKEKELERLTKKMVRIEAAKASGWEKNPYYYSDHDLRITATDIEEVKASIVTPASGGYVVDSMRIAVGSIATTGSFEEAVIEAVNLGGDADTNGAITGGLAGAWYGYDAIPEAWIAALAPDVRETLDRLADAAVAAREG